MAIVLGLAASISYGVADFLGGLASRWVRATLAVLVSQIVGLVFLLALVPAVAAEPLTGGAAGWGALAGLAGGLGVLFLYRGLGRGRMAVVAPISAVVGASVPVIVDLAVGDPVGSVTLAGLAVALVALALVSSQPDRSGDGGLRDGLAEGLLAGVGFGAFFVLLAQSGDGTGFWPILAVRVASVTMLAGIAAATRSVTRLDRRSLWALIPAGLLDTTANLLFLLGTRRGLLSVVAVLTSLYPAATVILARVVLAERLHRLQLVGLGGAAVGIVLITAG